MTEALETSLALVVQKLEHIEKSLIDMKEQLGTKLESHDDRLRKMEVSIAMIDHDSLIRLKSEVEGLRTKLAWITGIGAAITFALSSVISLIGLFSS